MASKPLPQAVMRIHSKRGENDCVIACLAMYLRRDPEEVLLAAGQVSRTVWQAGLACSEMVKVAKKLGVQTRWVKRFDPDEATGVLWVSYRDAANEHIVVLDEGRIMDPDHNPVSYWDQDDYFAHFNAYPNALLVRVED